MQSTTEKEKTFAYTLRTLEESDLPAFVEYIRDCAAREEFLESVTLEEFTEWYHNPSNHQRITLAHLANGSNEGQIIGMTDIEIKPGDSRSWGGLHVHPDYRNNGVGSALYAQYIRQANEADVTEMCITPDGGATLLIEFLKRRGYELERWFWNMQLPAEQELETPGMPEGFITHTFMRGQDEEMLTEVRNVTFANHYGSVPRTVEEMTYRTKQSDFHADGVFFAFEGNKVAGFCYTTRDPREWERRGETVGHIQLLGVVPEYRGRGLGRALLLEGVNYLRQYVSLIELGVEGKNDNAVALYESIGFKQHKAWANMVKARKAGGR